MDYKKIGCFLASERKNKKLTQSQLAQNLFVSEKTISKWENGKSLPDTSILPKLCEIFEVSINEILNGERISKEDYSIKAEKHLLELKKEKEDRDKMLLTTEIVLGIVSITSMLIIIALAAFLAIALWLKILLISFGVLEVLISAFFMTKIEQKAGYYECQKCHKLYLPTFNQVLWSMHVNRTRYMKCPHCKQKSWDKKVLH